MSRLDLRPADEATAELAALTNNTRDFTKSIVEIEVVYPSELPESG